jgi:GNAT superfamily N-acetyltransferase
VAVAWVERPTTDYLNRADLRHWTANLGGDQVGLVSLRFAPDEVEIDTFGLVPERVGRGLGGTFLTLATELAWRECPQARRVWLHTSNQDHPRALANYERHGFRRYRTVLPDEG